MNHQRTYALLGLAVAMFATSAPARAACNEQCLSSMLDRYLAQLVKHNAASLPVSDTLIAVENAKPVKLGEGSWQTVMAWTVPGHRFADASTGQIVYYGATTLADSKVGSLFVRLKVVNGRIAESELFTRGAYTGEGQETRGLLEPDILYPTLVPAARRSTRAQLIGIVNAYMDGISQHNGALFPASERCDRYQAGRKFTNSYITPVERGGGTCQGSMTNLKGQTVVNRRFPVVDVERGIGVGLFVIPHGERTPQNATNVAEVFKIVDGKVRSIEEFSFIGGFPPSSGFADSGPASPGPDIGAAAGRPGSIVDALAAPGAVVTRVGSGYQFTEGPAVDAMGNVYFADIPNEKIYKWTAATGEIALYREHTGKANGMMFDREGRLVVCEMGNKRVVRDDLHGGIVTLADNYRGAALHMPNDLWIDARGGVYFSDFAGAPGSSTAVGLQLYYRPADGGDLRRVTEDLKAPNGLIGTPDGRTLYVTDPAERKTWSYRINDDASLSGKALFADQGADGMALDERGNLYLSGQSIAVYAPTGQKLQEIAMPNDATNFKFAGQDRKTLFIAARDAVYTLSMKVRGAPSPLDLAGRVQ